MKKTYRQQTQAVRAGLCSDKQCRALIPPIHLSSTYALPAYQQKGDYDYSRTNNPTRNLLGDVIAALEDGSKGIITNTGMSAILLVCQLLSPDDVLVAPHDGYGGTYRLFEHYAKRGLFKLIVIDQNDDAAVVQALAEKPKLVWLETPSNPILRIYDIRAMAQKAHDAGALVAVDNTFLSPVLQKPLVLGADIVVHSCTKFINGHSDIVAGAVVTKSAELGEELAWWANCIGVTGSPFDSYMVMRGIRTLSVRIKQHEDNAQQIAELLCHHEAVKRVYYPGLQKHPGHEVACKQQQGFGALLSFDLQLGEWAVAKLLENLDIFTQAQSLGGVESLINHPATMTHAAMSDDAKAIAGVSMGLLRLSVGIEAIEDLHHDLEKALNTCVT